MARKKDPSSVTALEVFPMRLRELMKREPRTTQPKLAKALGIQRQTVSNYANGQSSPDWKTLAAIADFFHVSADYLLGLSDEPQVTLDGAAADPPAADERRDTVSLSVSGEEPHRLYTLCIRVKE